MAVSNRLPSRNVLHTATAPRIGTTKNMDDRIAVILTASAMAIGRPGAYVGTIAPRYVAGRYPSGDKVHSAEGHGTTKASGCGTCSVPAVHRSAWLTYPYASEPHAHHVPSATAT